jgi:hypothetical protein
MDLRSGYPLKPYLADDGIRTQWALWDWISDEGGGRGEVGRVGAGLPRNFSSSSKNVADPCLMMHQEG